eukprot:SM000793S22540  [mRNA]  locus=s793:74:2083:- [translate_table: standard]
MISPMHVILSHKNTVIFIDRTDVGPTRINTTAGNSAYSVGELPMRVTLRTCISYRRLSEWLIRNRTADVELPSFLSRTELRLADGNLRGLNLATNSFCSAGHTTPNGMIMNNGGTFIAQALNNPKYNNYVSLRRLMPCDDGTCDWDSSTTMAVNRWYPVSQRMPNGNIVLVGGSASNIGGNGINNQNQASFEYLVKAPKEKTYPLLFLNQTLPFNLYPFLHLMKNGRFFLFANWMSCEIDLTSPLGQCTRYYPNITSVDGQLYSRSHPYTSAGAVLAIRPEANYTEQYMICGGGQALPTGTTGIPPAQTCGTINLNDDNPQWVYEIMPGPKIMGTLVVLPTGQMVFTAGVKTGMAGYYLSANPSNQTYMYDPTVPLPDLPANSSYPTTVSPRWSLDAISSIPRVYHSSVTMLPDATVMIAGSNYRGFYTDPYPLGGFLGTEFRVETFYPPYWFVRGSMGGVVAPKPVIAVTTTSLAYSQTFTITWAAAAASLSSVFDVVIEDAGFNTHGTTMGQRVVGLVQVSNIPTDGAVAGVITATAPPNANLAPPGYYMVFVVVDGVPSSAVW